MRYFLFLLVCSFCACSNGLDTDELKSQVESAEKSIGANPDATDEEIKILLAKYESYVASPGADAQLAVDYLLRAGDVSVRLKDFERTVGYYDKVLTEYPSSQKAPKALFMKAFTLDNKMGRLEEAKKVYEEFLTKYPDDDFAKDAAFSLKNLGKSAEEIIKEFEAQKEGQEEQE